MDSWLFQTISRIYRSCRALWGSIKWTGWEISCGFPSQGVGGRVSYGCHSQFPLSFLHVESQTKEHLEWETGRHLASYFRFSFCDFPGQRLSPSGFRGIWLDCVFIEWELLCPQHHIHAGLRSVFLWLRAIDYLGIRAMLQTECLCLLQIHMLKTANIMELGGGAFRSWWS